MPYQPQLEFANFICKFGEELNLVDFLDDIVYPAFTDTALRRSYGRNEYLFHDVRAITLDASEPIVALAGTFVKRTVFEREYVFTDVDGLKQDDYQLENAQVSLFVLVLNSHKLLYLRETHQAPSLVAFRATAISFLRNAHERMIRSTHDSRAAEGKTVTLKKLREETPPPELQVVALASPDDLKQFVDQFSVLRLIKLELLTTNDEIDNEALFSAVRDSKAAIHAKTTVVQHHNPEGLDKAVALEQLQMVAGKGNTKVVLRGKDMLGDSLSGTEDEFRLSIPQSNLPAGIDDRFRHMYNSFKEQVSHGVIAIRETRANVIEKIARFVEGLM